MLQFLRKYLNILLFSWRDGVKMNASDIGLGKKMTLAICDYCSKESLMPPTSSPPLIILKISLSGVWNLE